MEIPIVALKDIGAKAGSASVVEASIPSTLERHKVPLAVVSCRPQAVTTSQTPATEGQQSETNQFAYLEWFSGGKRPFGRQNGQELWTRRTTRV